MNSIPFAVLALGSARNYAFAEDLMVGVSTGRP